MAKLTLLSEPNVVVEIWSRSSRWLDLTLKLGDDRGVTSIRSILFLSRDRPNDGLEAGAVLRLSD